MGQRAPVSQNNLYEGLTQAIDRMAAMLLLKTEGSGDTLQMEEALHALQGQLTQLQLGEGQETVQKDYVAFSLADAAKENLRYKQLFESVALPYVTTDQHGEVRKANAIACEVFHLDIDDSKGMPLVSCVAKSDRRSFRKALKQLTDGRALFIPSLLFQQRNGDEPVEYGVHAIPAVTAETDHKEIDWLLTPILAPVKMRTEGGIGNDVLSIETLKENLLQNGEEFTIAELQTFRGYAASHKTLSDAVDVVALLESTVAEIANLIGDHCFLSVLSPEGTSLIPTAAATNKHASDEVIRQFLQAEAAPLSANFAQKVVTSQLPYIITNKTTTETPLDRIFQEGPVNMLMIPLRAGKTSLGLLNLLRDDTANPYQDYEVVIVQNLADHVGLILRYLDSTAHFQDPAADTLHAAFLGEVCTELQASLHPLHGYVEMLKEQAQELKLKELEDDLSLVVKTAAYSNGILADTFDIVQIDAGVRKPSVDSHPVNYFVSELVGIIRRLSSVEDLTFDTSTCLDGALVQSDMQWAGQMIQKIIGCISCESAQIGVTANCAPSGVSIIIRCTNGLFTHQLTGHSCAIESSGTKNNGRPFYQRGVAMNLAQRLSNKLGAKITYSSDEAAFETVTVTFPLTSQSLM